MKMLDKSLKEAFEIVAGKSAESLVDLLDGKKYINEFLIAKKMNLTINQTRNLLYKISDQGLVSSIRKKDKRKGWYTYFWKIEIMKCLEFLRSSLLKKIEQVQHQIKSRQTKEFYICERCNIEFTEESALVHNFECNECGGILSRRDNVPVIKEHNRDLERFKRDLLLIESELGVEKAKFEKVQVKERKKEDEEKKALRKKNSQKRKKERESLGKKLKTKKVKTKGSKKKKI